MPRSPLSPIMLTPPSNINGGYTSSSTVPADLLLHDSPLFSEDVDSTCSTPFVSAPSSPGHEPSGYFFSAPASPRHSLLLTENTKTLSSECEPVYRSSDSETFEFEFSSRFSPNGSNGNGFMTSADELFFNGQIRPMRLSSHLQRPRGIAAFVDLDGEDVDKCANIRGRDLRMRSNKHAHRKARSMSPLRTAQYQWHEFNTVATNLDHEIQIKENECEATPSGETTPSCSASSSRSSSSGRNSKKWTFLKEFLQRSKSEGRANHREKYLWSVISLSSARNRKNSPPSALWPSSSVEENKGKDEKETQKQKKGRKIDRVPRKAANGVWKRRVRPSAHELHYTANRAQAEEMKKKTFLPYRQGFLGFSSKSYGAFSGFTRNLKPISSR